MRYQQHYSTRHTPQTQPIPGKKMVEMESGGFAYKVDKWTQLDRFLILGTQGGTYYIGERELTVKNCDAVVACIKEDGVRLVNRVVEVSDQGLAPKNDPALFVLAMASAFGDEKTRAYAFEALDRVARIGTHLFQFCDFREAFAGWGRGMRSAVSNWYTRKEESRLAYQLLKYKQRNGWSHRDVLRLAHPKPQNETQNALFKYTTQGIEKMEVEERQFLPNQVKAYEEVAYAHQNDQMNVESLIQYIQRDRLTREMIPTEYLNDRNVMAAMLNDMPMHALIRNLGNLTRIGVLAPLSDNSKYVADKLVVAEAIHRSRLHPFSILAASSVYGQGHGARGRGEWTPDQQIMNALEAAFYLSFQNVVPSGKKIVCGIDWSGSMGGPRSYSGRYSYGGYGINGVPGMSPAYGAAAMALITNETEDQVHNVVFAGTIKDISLRKGMKLSEVMELTARGVGEGTDCALPLRYAMSSGMPAVDAFVLYTDSQSWRGPKHVSQVIDMYRQHYSHPTKLVVVQMTSNDYSVADAQDDPLSLNVIGFDTSAPKIISDFVAGRF